MYRKLQIRVLCALAALLMLLCACSTNEPAVKPAPEAENTAAVTTEPPPETTRLRTGNNGAGREDPVPAETPPGEEEPAEQTPETAPSAPATEPSAEPEPEWEATLDPAHLPDISAFKDFDWPYPRQGGRLFVGEGHYKEAERFYCCFVLDGNEIASGFYALAEGLTLDTEEFSFTGKQVCQECGGQDNISDGEAEFVNATLRISEFEDNVITGELEYSYSEDDWPRENLGKTQVIFYCYADYTAPPLTEPPENPVTAQEWFYALNSAAPEDFDAMYDRCMAALPETGEQEEWELLAGKVSAYYDFTRNPQVAASKVWENRPVYDDTRCDLKEYRWELPFRLVDEGLNPLLFDKIYTPGSVSLRLPQAFWLAEEFADCYSGEPENFKPSDPQPLYVLAVDTSAEVCFYDEAIVEISDDRKCRDALCDRAQRILYSVNRLADERLVFTADPEKASILLKFNVSYPQCGHYYLDGATADGFSFCLTVQAYSLNGTGKTASFKVTKAPPDTINVYSLPEIVCARIPQLSEYEEVQAFAAALLDW